MNIITEYPSWLILACVVLAGLYVLALYFREKQLPESANWLKVVLAVLRFGAVFIISFLLLGPLIKTVIREVEKPIVVVAQDNSESLVIGKDSTYYQQEYLNELNALKENLKEDYDVRSYTFGDAVNETDIVDFKDKTTDISNVFKELNDRYSNRNLGAVIIASDGIYNKGSNPQFYKSGLQTSVYTIALGDTTVKTDILIKDVAHNRLAYLGNEFPIEVLIEANKLIGEEAIVSIEYNGNTLFSERLHIDQENYQEIVKANLTAAEVGIQAYTVKVSTIAGEENTQNNSREIFIDVLDSRQKILILANSPHPDIEALRSALSSNQNYEVTVSLAEDFSGSIRENGLVILHQLPSNNFSIEKVLEEVKSQNIPLFCIVGSQTNFDRLRNMPLGLSINNFKNSLNETSATISPGFNTFGIDEELKKLLEQAPPLSVPFGNVVQANSIDVLLTQKIGSVKTAEPLLAMNRVGEMKTATLLGEGLWRWRIYNYAIHQNHRLFDELVSKIAQYLAVRNDRRLFRVFGENNFMENEPIRFDAELYNESYELVNEPEINISFESSEGDTYAYTFSKTNEAYKLDAGLMPVGNYTYRATTTYNNEQHVETGRLSISPFQLEAAGTTANHSLLYNLAAQRGGDMFYPGALSGLTEAIKNNEELVSVSYTRDKFSDLINLKWLFFVILGLVSLEWFLRKRNGAY